ncbi:MAG: 1-deoxy-D-xylulose-5-phosphate reductoisomerase [Planctomycetota bacterium]
MSPASRDNAQRRVIVLGSTGSIGVNTLAVIDHLNRTAGAGFEVVDLAAGANEKLLCQQAMQHGVGHVALQRGTWTGNACGVVCHTGDDAALRLVEETESDLVVAAIVGTAGLRPTLRAIELGRDIALANKETLVAAGDVVMPAAQRHGVKLLPVDSEHAAIWQCLQSHGQRNAPNRLVVPGVHTDDVRRIVLTASGGAFRDTDAKTAYHATAEQALKHPTWDMGPKVTIDSATMMNKALELLEAHFLFGVPAEKLTALIHPQSVVHGLVEFADHSVLAQLAPPDMRTPIQAALAWPDRSAGCSRMLDWTKLSRLDFAPPQAEKYPAIPLAYRVMQAGGTSGALFNAANEAAVDAFLNRRVPFGRIVELVTEALDALPAGPADSLDAVLDADARARRFVEDRLATEPMTPTPV